MQEKLSANYRPRYHTYDQGIVGTVQPRFDDSHQIFAVLSKAGERKVVCFIQSGTHVIVKLTEMQG